LTGHQTLPKPNFTQTQTRDTGLSVLRQVIDLVPYHIHTILTDNGIQFANRQKDYMGVDPLFDRLCHRTDRTSLTKSIIRGRRTSRANESNDQRCDRQTLLLSTHEQLKDHLQLFMTAYYLPDGYKTLNGLTPYEYIVKCWQNDKERFRLSKPRHFGTEHLVTACVSGIINQTANWKAF
jgi:hypothetical protein